MPWEVIYSIFLIDYDRHTKSLYFGDGECVNFVLPSSQTFIAFAVSPSRFHFPASYENIHIYFSHFLGMCIGIALDKDFYSYLSIMDALATSIIPRKHRWPILLYFRVSHDVRPKISFHGCFMFWGSETAERKPSSRAIPRLPKFQCIFQSITHGY